MTQVVADRYSEAEAERAILKIVREEGGWPDATLTLDETVDLCFKRCDGPNSIWARLGHGTWEELDFAEILFEINAHFGLNLGIQDWEDELHAGEPSSQGKERIPTWRDIAAVITAKAERIEVESRTVLGRSCMGAGVFDSLTAIAMRVTRNDQLRIAPSDSIQARLGRRMIEFRRRVEVNFGLSLPDEPFPRTVFGRALTIVAISGAVAGIILLLLGKFSLAAYSAVLLVFVWIVNRSMDRYWAPFPPELRTFKGLSRWLVAQLGE